MALHLPKRHGARPKTTPTNPHTQLDQNPSPEMRARFLERFFGLPATVEAPSGISVPGSRALVVEPGRKLGPRDAFLLDREFVHVHPPTDGSLHVALPPLVVAEVMDNGWAEVHPVALRGMIPMNVVMVFGPRDEGEIDVVMKLVEASRLRAIPD